MTRDVFEHPENIVGGKTQEWLNLWIPYREDIIRIFNPENRQKLRRISDSEFTYSGKKFRFLLAEDGRVFARTKEKMWILSEFVEHYQDFEFEETEGDPQESYSYSQIIIEDHSYHEQ